MRARLPPCRSVHRPLRSCSTVTLRCTAAPSIPSAVQQRSRCMQRRVACITSRSTTRTALSAPALTFSARSLRPRHGASVSTAAVATLLTTSASLLSTLPRPQTLTASVVFLSALRRHLHRRRRRRRRRRPSRRRQTVACSMCACAVQRMDGRTLWASHTALQSRHSAARLLPSMRTASRVPCVVRHLSSFATLCVPLVLSFLTFFVLLQHHLDSQTQTWQLSLGGQLS